MLAMALPKKPCMLKSMSSSEVAVKEMCKYPGPSMVGLITRLRGLQVLWSSSSNNNTIHDSFFCHIQLVRTWYSGF